MEGCHTAPVRRSMAWAWAHTSTALPATWYTSWLPSLVRYRLPSASGALTCRVCTSSFSWKVMEAAGWLRP